MECRECRGKGVKEYSIKDIIIEPSMKNHAELLALQKDAMRVTKQHDELCRINPSRKESYAEQLRGCLFIINNQAEKARK